MLLFLLLFGAAGELTGAQPKIQPGTHSIYKKRYFNNQYGYSFLIPRGYQGRCSPPPMPQHGLTIDLSKEKDESRRIVFFAHYDVLGQGSLDTVIRDSMSELQTDSAFQLLRKKTVYFKHVSALGLNYRLNGQPIEEVFAYRKEKKVAVIYQWYLKTTKSHYKKDKITFEKILNSLKFAPRLD